MFGFATSAIAADVNWITFPTASGETHLWSNTANWSGGAIPTDGQSLHVAPSSTNPNTVFDLDVDIAVNLPNSDMTFKNQKVKLVGSGSLVGRDFATDQQGGGKPEFHVPVTARDVNSTYGNFYGGLTADVFNNKNTSLIGTTASTLGEVNQTSDGIMRVNVPLSIRSGGTGNTSITKGSYRASVAGGVMGGTVTISAVTDTGARTGAGSLSMVDQTPMPTAITLGGIGNGLVIDDDASLIYGTNVTLPTDSAFRDKSSGQVSTGAGPTAAQLPGLIYWAMDETSNGTRTSNIHTLTTNSEDSDSPYKGFAFGTFSSNVGTEQNITLQMGAGETNNMQILTAWYNNNGSKFGDDTTMKHSGAAGASTTADILMVVGSAGFSGAINQKAINAGGAEATNLIDTFNLIANTPGMRLLHKDRATQVLDGQEIRLDNGYMNFRTKNGGNIQGTIRILEGATLFYCNDDAPLHQLDTATGKFVIEDGGQLQIENLDSLELLTPAQIETPGSDATLGLNKSSIDFDTAVGPVLSNLMSRVKVINTPLTATFLGTDGLTLADGQYLGNPWLYTSTISSSSKITATAGKDLHLAAFGTKTLNIEGNLNAGANKIVIGTDPGVELYSVMNVSGNGNASETSYHVQKMRPTGYVEFDNNTTFNAAPSLDVKSGQLRLRTAAFSFANLNLGDDGVLDFETGGSLTVTGTLSGTGDINDGVVTVGSSGSVAPGASAGKLGDGSGTLALDDGATYSLEVADPTTGAGTGYDTVHVNTLDSYGALTIDLTAIDGLTADLTSTTDIYVVATASTYTGDCTLVGDGGTVTVTGDGWSTSGATLTRNGNDLELSGIKFSGSSGTVIFIK